MIVSTQSTKKGKARRGGVQLNWICTRLMTELSGFFLEVILLNVGFRAEWVNMIMVCVSTVEYRVRYNSVETESFTPTRGL